MNFTIPDLYYFLERNNQVLDDVLVVWSRLYYSCQAVYYRCVKLYACFDRELFTCRFSSSGKWECGETTKEANTRDAKQLYQQKRSSPKKLDFVAIIMWRLWSNLSEAPEMKVRKRPPRIRIRIRDRSRSHGSGGVSGAKNGWMAGYRIATEIRFWGIWVYDKV